MNKKGDYKWGIVLSLILGLMVLSLSLYFIFHELWSEEDIDRQICRQSIQLRALLPDSGYGIDALDFKSDYPLKCKTHVVEISKKDVVLKGGRMDAERKIAEAMAECWVLYGNGDENAFPAKFFKSSSCVPCARIHLTDEAKDELGSRTINIRDALDLQMREGYTYYQFLRDSGKKFSAFDFGNGLAFNLSGNGFEVLNRDGWWKNIELKNKIGGEFTARMRSVNVTLPKFFDVTKGDLLINYGIVTIRDEDFGDYIPYLFYFQTEDGNPFDEVKHDFIFNFWKVPSTVLSVLWDIPEKGLKETFADRDVGFCEEWEGIPA